MAWSRAVETLWVGAVVIGAALVAPGCDRGVECTLEIRTAVHVVVDSPQGLPIDSVVADNGGPMECRDAPTVGDSGAGEPQRFDCWEQGGGTYEVTVTSGELSWTQSVHIDADACHTTERATLTFTLDPDTANP